MKLKVKIIPNASKNEIVGEQEGVLKIKIKTQPEKGKANKELIKFLAKEWDIPKSSISIVKGMRSKIKILQINEN